MSADSDGHRSAWPDIDVSGWPGTKRSLHAYAQMLGKLRLALSPPQPNWMFTPLYLTPGGLSTGPMPFGSTSVEALLDVFSSELVVSRSTGAQRRIALLPARTIADVFRAVHVALAGVGVDCSLSSVPQEVPDTTPFDRDTRPAEYDPEAVRRWFRATTATCGIFDRWRARFFGRSGIQLWWGAFDVALILFNGRHVTPPTDRGYLMKYDLDAELMNCGLYFGDERTPPFFYGYIFPQPSGAERLAMAPDSVTWSTAFNEWVLPYDRVREASTPPEVLRAFLDSLYGQCVTAAGWDRVQLSYVAPTRRAPRT